MIENAEILKQKLQISFPTVLFEFKLANSPNDFTSIAINGIDSGLGLSFKFLEEAVLLHGEDITDEVYQALVEEIHYYLKLISKE